MIVKSTNHSHFYRKNGVVFEVTTDGYEMPIYKFPIRHPDREILSETGIKYLNRWIEFYPNEAIKLKLKQNIEEGQLKLF